MGWLVPDAVFLLSGIRRSNPYSSLDVEFLRSMEVVPYTTGTDLPVVRSSLGLALHRGAFGLLDLFHEGY